MKTSNKFSGFTIFLALNGALCLFYFLAFSPVSIEARGDSPAYIDLAKQLFNLQGANVTDLSHRSPLYSFFLGIFIVVFGQDNYLVPTMFFQHSMIFFSAIMIYNIFFALTENRTVAFIAGTMSTVNLSTVFFGYMILSETLAMFLLTMTVFLLVQYYNKNKIYLLALTGISAGFMVLTRFNAIGIPLVILFVLITINFIRYRLQKLRTLGIEMIVIIVTVSVTLNIMAIYNLKNRGIYELFPADNVSQRWAIPATINEKSQVSDEYKDVLSIFLRTRETEVNKSQPGMFRKASLLNNRIILRVNNFFKPKVSGYKLYRDSEGALLKYYNLDYSAKSISLLNKKLQPFYAEIARQNRKELFKLRIYSFLYSFKHSSPTLPESSSIKNLNVLPSFILILYKILIIFFTLVTFSISLIHFFRLFLDREKLKRGYYWIILYAIIWYFPLINFYANVLGDANRFKYPAEPIILGLFVSYFFYFINKLKKRYLRMVSDDTTTISYSQ